MVIFFMINGKTNETKKESKINQFPTIASIETYNSPQNTKYSLFFPYWTLPDNAENIHDPTMDQLSNWIISQFIYFGITPNSNGINKEEAGSANLEKFANTFPDSPKNLAVRMINADNNLKILETPVFQQKIVAETIALAKQYGFTHILYDFELKAIPTENIIAKVTEFIKNSSQQVRTANLGFSMTIYGDAFYRRRPYDLAALEPYVDQFFIMAYDFHKAGGEPGPNFPVSGAETYGYDFNQMTTDFLRHIPPEKINVVFGLFGYDWTVDDKDRPIKPAKALTLAQIKKRFIDNCSETNCQKRRDETSFETKITYFDEAGAKHIIWFEDEESVVRKIDNADKAGISRFSFWAYGYY